MACGKNPKLSASHQPSFGSGGTSSGGATGGAAGTTTLAGGANNGGSESTNECDAENPCAAGVCVDGVCCETEELGCHGICCDSGQFCSFDKCIDPGGPCQSAADCADEQYCETALADEGAGGQGECGVSVLAQGRCVDMPPVCASGAGGAGGTGGAGGGSGDCIELCEFRPEAGNLTTNVKWQWGIDIPPKEYAESADVWATPAIARVFDANCDEKVDESDPPNVIFVSGDAKQTCCSCGGYDPSTCLTGVLRLLDGRSGDELWSLAESKPGNGFAGMSVAVGDVDGDKLLDIVTVSQDGYVVMVDGKGVVQRVSDLPIDESASGGFGWGGGLALGDMDGDGHPEIAFGRSLFSTKDGAITRLWVGDGGRGGQGSGNMSLSFFADLDMDGALELVAGNTVYELDGTKLWQSELPDGFNAVADFDGDGLPEVVLVRSGDVWVLEGATGALELGPVTLPGGGKGGPPTVADFDADGSPEIGVAEKSFYVMLKPNYQPEPTPSTLDLVWQADNHDFSSSVTGSSVFDFEGDGKAEVVYNDECFLWVYDGATGEVLLGETTMSFTATEASLVADVDADGHAEIVMVSNAASPASWKCEISPWTEPDPEHNRPGWAPPDGHFAHRGITVFGDKANSWVGTRTVWNQHAYSVTNVCDSRDSACDAPNTYGALPKTTKHNWIVPWLNNFRQNVQDKGLFSAPDAVVSLKVLCTEPATMKVTVQNIGMNGLPAGVEVVIFHVASDATETTLGTVQTTRALAPGQRETLDFTGPDPSDPRAFYRARILIDEANRTFNECREDNNESELATATCGPG